MKHTTIDVDSSAAGTAVESDEQKVKSLAASIIKAIGTAENADDAEHIIGEWADELETIKAASQAAYDHVIAQKNKKLVALEGK